MSETSQRWEYETDWLHLTKKMDWKEEIKKTLNRVARQGWELHSGQLVDYDDVNQALYLSVYKRPYKKA